MGFAGFPRRDRNDDGSVYFVFVEMGPQRTCGGRLLAHFLEAPCACWQFMEIISLSVQLPKMMAPCRYSTLDLTPNLTQNSCVMLVLCCAVSVVCVCYAFFLVECARTT